MVNIDIYTDGGCRGNPGIGSYAMIVYRDNQPIFKLGDYTDRTTNSIMELQGFIAALDYIVAQPERNAYHIYSDSNYVVRTYNEWLTDWVLTGRVYMKANKGLWIYVNQLKNELMYKGIQVTVEKVKGHSGDPKNTEVDKLVNTLMDKKEKMNIKLNHPSIDYLIQNQIKGFSDTEVNEVTDIFTVRSAPEVEVSKIVYVPESSKLKFLLDDGTYIEMEASRVTEAIDESEKNFIDMTGSSTE